MRRILLLVNERGWALDGIAQAIVRHLKGRYHFEILASADRPAIVETHYDLIHILYDYEEYHLPFLSGRIPVIRSVYSHYWQQWGMTPQELYARYLSNAHAVTVPSMKLLHALRELPVQLRLFPEGVESDVFRPDERVRSGPLVVGWAGNPEREIKRLPLLRNACDGLCELRITNGSLTEKEMVGFYNDIDIIACSSQAEGCPRPVLEGMACGAFPVSFDVGIIPELIEDGVNGMIVRRDGYAVMREALLWCVRNTDAVRAARALNAQRIRADRQWSQTVPSLARLYDDLLA